MYRPERNFIRQELNSILNNIVSKFDKGELAFLTLQQKNERQIRDKVAWCLQDDLDKIYGPGKLMVRCEWPSCYDECKLDYTTQQKLASNQNDKKITKRSAVDMAILLMDDNGTDYVEVLALIEFKAHSFLNYEKWPYEHFSTDVTKMWKMTQLGRIGKSNDKRLKDADLYFIMLTSSHNKRNCKQYGSAVVYKDILDKGGKNQATLYPQNPNNYVNQLKDFWKGFYNLSFDFGGTANPVKVNYNISYKGVQPNTVPSPKIQPMGNTFGYEMYLTCMIWGPYKYSNLSIK